MHFFATQCGFFCYTLPIPPSLDISSIVRFWWTSVHHSWDNHRQSRQAADQPQPLEDTLQMAALPAVHRWDLFFFRLTSLFFAKHALRTLTPD